MQLNTVIFDMDGLLIDSEPLWQEAGSELLNQFDLSLTDEQYRSSTGLRTPEWIDHWFTHFGISKSKAKESITITEEKAIKKITFSYQFVFGDEKVKKLLVERLC